MKEIDHVAMIVSDADHWAEYYSKHFGLEQTGDEELAEPRARLVHLRAGKVMLQLVQPRGRGRLMDDMLHFGDSLHHLCFRVSDLQGFLAALPGEATTRTFVGGGGRRACFLTNPPASVRIELVEEKQVRQTDRY